jgi:hypothetical protein
MPAYARRVRFFFDFVVTEIKAFRALLLQQVEQSGRRRSSGVSRDLNRYVLPRLIRGCCDQTGRDLSGIFLPALTTRRHTNCYRPFGRGFVTCHDDLDQSR